MKTEFVFIVLFVLITQLFSEEPFIDSRNRKLHLLNSPERIIVTSPEVQEILYALKVHDKIIANVKYCDYPEELQNLPRVGDFKNPNIERIVKLKPDLIILTDYIQKDTVFSLSKLKYQVFVVHIKSIDELVYFIETFGRMFNKAKKSKKLIKKIYKELRKIKIPEQKPNIFPIIWDKPLMSAGEGTLINEIIKKSAGINLAAKAGKGYVLINKEFLIKNKPDYFLLCDKNINVKENLKFVFKKYPDIRIIDNINPDFLLRAGPRIIKGIKKLNKIIIKGL